MIETQESITAKLCSFARAFHSNNERRKIFDDYLAYDLMGKDEYEGVRQLIGSGFEMTASDKNYTYTSAEITKTVNRYIAPIPLSRIAFAEQRLLDFAQEHERCQYVICGAGMDTFAFRNINDNITIFELDHPDTGRYKRERISDLEWNIPKGLTFVPIDFSKDDMTKKLSEASFDPQLPSFFAILGITYYLTLPVFEQTISKIRESCSGSCRIVFDYPDETTLSGARSERITTLSKITEKLGERIVHGYSYEEISTVLSRHGFSIAEHETPEKIQRNYFSHFNGAIKAFENVNFMLAEN